jgi:hypothetical protein
MATKKVTVNKNTWTELTAVDASFQLVTPGSIFVTKQATAPASAPSGAEKIADFKSLLGFVAGGEKLYAYSINRDAVVAVDE